MSARQSVEEAPALRAREWQRSHQAAVCDLAEPWAHGTVLRASRYPTYYSFNVVRIEEDPEIGAQELVAFADQALAGLSHRRLDFEEIDAAESRRAELVALGWRPTRLLWMRHEQPLPPAAGEIEVSEVPYEAADGLRRAWHAEEDDGSEYEHFQVAAREVAETRGVRVLTVADGPRAIAFAQLEWAAGGAEITQVYVDPEYRGGGRGAAITRAAVRAAADADDLWIIADEEDRPKELYRRLGFRGVWSSMEFLWLP
jgi:ribosomal protein S18 acetylase RimI-like enzyme